MSEKPSEKAKMSSVEFVQNALHDHVAPPSIGSVKSRIRYAAWRLSWSFCRAKDAWYADPRINISADELRAVEQLTGLHYGQKELRTNEHFIATATALLDSVDPDFHGPFIAALVALAGAFSGSRTGR